jgi:hypothetical protein
VGNKTFLTAVFAMAVFAGSCLAQTVPKEPEAKSLCSLQQTVTEGNHETVRVSGIYREGPELGVLEDVACPKEGTWVELELRSHENKKKLYKLLDHSRRASVMFEGEFYGSPLPDPKLPETIKRNYHPGWGHLSAFKTKLVVYAIREVRPAPAEPTNGASLNHEAKHAEETFASVDPKDGSLHLEIPAVAAAKPRQ